MKIKIKRIDKSLPLPVYETNGAVGFDIIAREDIEIPSKGLAMIPSNLIVEVPETHMLVIASRSSTPYKKGLMPPHGFGIIDHDYCGPEDEIRVLVHNFKDETVKVARGEKIAQGVFVKIDKFEWEEQGDISAKNSRGGFGSTGGYM